MVAVPRTSPAHSWPRLRSDLALLAVATVALRIPAYVADRHLTFDDGVYGASAVAMRTGEIPFRDVFSSQGPLFLPLVYAADALGLRTMDAPRLLSVLAGVVLVSTTYLAGRELTDRGGALVAAGLVSTAGSVLWVTGPIAADGVALAFAMATVLLAIRWRAAITTRRALLLGLGVSATLSVKALLAPVIVPVALVLLAHRRVVPILAGASVAVASHLLLWLPWGAADVWDQSYAYHLEVATERTPGANLMKVLSTLGDRDALVVVAVLLAIGAVLAGRSRSSDSVEARLTAPTTLLLAWLATTAVVLLSESPLWRPHVSQLVPGLALLAVGHRPPPRVLAVATLVGLPYHLTHVWDILRPTAYASSSEQTLDVLRSLPDGAQAISDDPGIVWRAGRRTPSDLVDASILRIETGDITASSIAAAAADDQVCAVVVRSSVRWGSFDDLPELLRAEGYEVVLGDAPSALVYVARDCRPG